MDGLVMLLAALLLGGPPEPVQDTTTPAIALAARRFYQQDAGGTTVEVLAELNLRRVAATTGPVTRYRVAVTVQDSAGTTLTESAWNREVPATVARRPGASATESFRFSAVPGRYTVRLLVSADGIAPLSQAVEVTAFRARPPMSDLVLATGVRAAEDSGAVAPGEIRRGTMAMRSAPMPRFPLDSVRVTYYAEVYPWRPDGFTGQLRVEVSGAGGRRMVQTPARQVSIDAAGGVARGSLDLTGLPEGRYTLKVMLAAPDSTISAEAPFEVAARPAPTAERPAAPSDPFETMSEQGLDSLYGPTEYLLESRERGTYNALSLAGKRRFMQDLWRRRDPTPQTPDNPALTDFLRTLAFVNASFREAGAAGRPGWLTDRGRVYLRNGAPQETLRRPSATPRPYEVWKFSRGRPLWYVFYDRSGLGNYELIGSNDVRESSQSGWEAYLGPEGAQDVREFIR
jgi:GWxTD domain-containing protein